MRRIVAGLLAGAALCCPDAARAAAPAPQRAAIEDGATAIVRYADGAAGRRALAARAARAGLDARFLRVLPMAAVRGPAGALRALARGSEVRGIHSDRPLAPELYQGTPLVFGGRSGIEQMTAAGYDGRGVGIAIVDTGVDGLHADLADHVVANHKVVGEGAGATVVPCPVEDCDTDENGHGTHVAGIAAGDATASEGFYPGVAPGASVVGYAVGAGPSILFAVTAYDDIVAHPERNVRVVNSSFGVSGGGRFDSADPINQATKRLHAAGITVVFSNGNSGTNPARQDPPGASDCSPSGTCKTNPYSVAPWVISAAAGRKDGPGAPSTQHLSTFSSRGDPQKREAISGELTDYAPTLTAPGVNVRSLRDPTATDSTAIALAGDPNAVAPPPGGESYEPFYTPLSGTSMAAPAVAGAVAVIQSAARAKLGRWLTPAEVEGVLTRSAQGMPGKDGNWDYPCPDFIECGDADPAQGFTGTRYERWQVGAGYLDVAGAVREVEAMAPKPDPDPEPDPNPVPQEKADATPTPVPAAAAPAPAAVTPPGPAAPAITGCLAPAPRATVATARFVLRRRVGRRVGATGTASGAGCARPVAVRVAVARRAGKRCRFLDAAGRLSRARSCRRRTYIPATGVTRWRLSLPAGDGRYVVTARAVDAAARRGPLAVRRVG